MPPQRHTAPPRSRFAWNAPQRPLSLTAQMADQMASGWR